MIRVIVADITKQNVDAIVNAANSGLLAGGGVCGAIFRAAGHTQLQAACHQIGHCPTGSAVITPGFQLAARHVIHAVGPIWQGGNSGEPQQLYGCYRRSLEILVANGLHSIAFPLISSGIYGYPKDKAWRKALQACLDFERDHPNAGLSITITVLSDAQKAQGESILLGLQNNG